MARASTIAPDPPIPCSKRAAIKTSTDCAAAQASVLVR